MKSIEQIIKNTDREELYNYYLSLGYNHKTSASLALFTYGQYRYKEFSIDDLYDALCKGEDYLPPEVIEERKRWEKELRNRKKRRRSAGIGYGLSDGALPSYGYAGASRCITFDGLNAVEEELDELYDCDGSVSSFDTPDFLCSEPMVTTGITEESVKCCRMASPTVRKKNIMDVAGALGFATDEYESIEEKDARNTLAEPTSTFRMTTNTASAGVILNQLRNGRRIDKSMVRIEEMLNYFRYDSKVPEKEMFNIACEMMDANNDKKYLYINVQGREEIKEKQNIIILLDVSGSMSGNTDQTQAMIATIISKLGNGDKLSIITYSDDDIIELEAFTVNGAEDRIRALEKLLSIEITGCTYGSKGIESAYNIGKKNFIEGGNNQVILITDGDLNFGITDKGGLEELIERKKKENLFLSVIGTGLWNYKDDKLEVLAKHGNGVYRTVNNLADVKKSIDEEYSSLVNIIAKDVKAQVEFNPAVVESYRLLGFENRTLSREDFTNDKVISEPFGSGGYGVAVYELKMKTDEKDLDSGLKYSKLTATESKEAGTVKVRYKEPLENVSHELEKVIETADASYTDNLRLAFIVYVCAEKLRGSDKISAEEIELAKKLYKELGDAVREKNSADLYKLAGILDKSEKELGIGIPEEPFAW